MGSSHTESAYWVYSRNMFSCIWYTATRVMRNPLADPGIIGVSSGAGFVAIVIMILFPQHLAFTTRGVFRSFHNSDGYLCFIMAKRGTTFKDRLSRVSINALIGAATSAIMLLHSDKVQSVLPWLAGGIGGVSWAHLNMIIYYAIVAIILAFGIKHIRVLMLGDEMAKLLGHNVEKVGFI